VAPLIAVLGSYISTRNVSSGATLDSASSVSVFTETGFIHGSSNRLEEWVDDFEAFVIQLGSEGP
jgi:hypothetical protein